VPLLVGATKHRRISPAVVTLPEEHKNNAIGGFMPLPQSSFANAPFHPASKALLLAASVICALPVHAQQGFGSFADFEAAALAALGSANLAKLEFTAEGWEACLGQPWRIDDGWARWELTDYRRVLDFAGGKSVHSAQRRAGLDPERIGGCGAQPDASAAPQQSSITPQSPHANQLTLWLTPQGFLKLAEDKDAAVTAENGGWAVTFNVSDNGISYPFTGHFGADLLPARIETRIDNTVYGDMLVEAEFSDYRDFAGVKFPGHLVHKQGGFAVLDLMIDGVTPNTSASAEPPQRAGGGGPGGGGGGGQAPALPTGVAEVGPGIFVSHGAYQSVFVEFDGYSVVIDGLQSDARAAEIIAQVKETIPGKPIRYVISTHNHFDHAGGLRAFAAEGATLITHNVNVDFFKKALAAPRTLTAQPAAATPPVDVMGVGDFFALSDETQMIELHRIVGDTHADDMLIAYLPSIKTVVEADLLQPWISPQFGGNYEGGHPFLRLLASELERMQLDYTQFIPVHRPPQPPFQSKQELLRAVGR
jgi:glyoxylase-like metal-dependent hydrolase (beta-lactamase superfamily II)